jgi:DNA-binding beta-propeller fold protein YncE
MKRSVLFVLLVAACDPASNYRPDADVVDSSVDAAVPGPRAAVVSGQFGGGGILSDLDVDSLAVRKDLSPSGGVGSDPVIRRFGDKVYVVNRYGGNSISVFNATTLRFLEQYGTGSGSNPQDVALVGDTMYVVAGPGIVKVKLATGKILGSINLATAVGDPDGNPDCVTIEKVDNKLYVACGLFDFDVTFAPRGNGKVAIIDTAASDAVSTVTLPSTNPLNFFVKTPATSVFDGDLLIGLSPSFSDYSTGCIARVSTGSTPTAKCAEGLDNSEVGGILTHMDISADGKLLWMAVNTNSADFSVSTGTLEGFDLDTGMLWTMPVSKDTQLITDVAACPDGSVIAVDRTMDAGGFRVFDKDFKERTTTALPFGLPPLFGNNTLCYDPSAL